MIDKHSSDYWLKSPNYCGNKIKCQRKGLEEKISKNLNEDKFNNMYNIFPINPNDVPYRKCVHKNVWENQYQHIIIMYFIMHMNILESGQFYQNLIFTNHIMKKIIVNYLKIIKFIII